MKENKLNPFVRIRGNAHRGKDRATVAGYQKYIETAREFPAMFPDIIRTDEILSPYFTAGIKKEAAL